MNERIFNISGEIALRIILQKYGTISILKSLKKKKFFKVNTLDLFKKRLREKIKRLLEKK